VPKGCADATATPNRRSALLLARLPSERPNFWNELPAPPEHESGFNIAVRPSIDIPVHRQVKSKVNHFWPGRWSPGSPGERSRLPSPWGSALSKGQVKDVLDPIVVEHADWFEWPARDVLPEDVERLRREEVNDRG